MIEKKIFNRFKAFFIDLITIGFLGGVLGFLTNKFGMLSEYVFYAIFFLFLFKDIVTPVGSIGKEIMKLKIIDISSNKSFFLGRKILRNISNIIWPIEFLIILITKKRLSDKFLNLDIVSPS